MIKVNLKDWKLVLLHFKGIKKTFVACTKYVTKMGKFLAELFSVAELFKAYLWSL